jgi:hypothetical protein
LRKLVGYYRRCPRIGLAAAAAGVSAPTVQAWRNRGRQELEFLEADQLDRILILRDAQTAPGGRPYSWREIEQELNMEISRFVRLELELLEAEHEAAREMFELVATAARGRADAVENPDGTIGTRWITPPQWTAAAWILERTFNFVKPTGRDPRDSDMDVEAGYAALAAQLAAVSGDEPSDSG